MSDLLADPYEEAEMLGLKVVLPKSDELFIDLDDEANRTILMEGLQVLEDNMFTFEVSKETVSKSGNAHIYVETGLELTDAERCLFQACLGSDLKRELLSALRIIVGKKSKKLTRDPTVFFEKEES